MANAVWPPSLPPQVLLAGYAEAPPETVLRTQMDAGPAKLRSRTTAAPRPIGGAVVLTSAQLATLDGFYVATLSGGALPFDWQHPRTLAAATFRFLSPPQYTALGGGHWQASLSLEAMP